MMTEVPTAATDASSMREHSLLELPHSSIHSIGVNTTSYNAETQKLELLDLFVSHPIFNEQHIDHAVSLLQRNPELAAQRFEEMGYEGSFFDRYFRKQMYPFVGLLVKGRERLQLQDAQAIYNLYPWACWRSIRVWGDENALHMACYFANADVIAFVARMYPRSALKFDDLANKLPLQCLLQRQENTDEVEDEYGHLLEWEEDILEEDRFSRPLETQDFHEAVNAILEVEPSSLLEKASKRSNSFLEDLLTKGYHQCIKYCVLDKLPKDLQHFHYRKQFLNVYTFRAIQTLLPKLKTFQLSPRHLYFDGLSLLEQFTKIVEKQNKVTCVIVSRTDSIEWYIGNNSEKVRRLHYYSFMNKHGRLVASNPMTPLPILAGHVEALINDKTPELKDVKTTVLYGLLRESPGLWSGGMHMYVAMGTEGQQSPRKRKYDDTL